LFPEKRLAGSELTSVPNNSHFLGVAFHLKAKMILACGGAAGDPNAASNFLLIN
jgi:hypothetical protein